jgi:CHAT domain-containing protein
MQAPAHRYLHAATHVFFSPPNILSAAAPREKSWSDLFGKAMCGTFIRVSFPELHSGENRPPTSGEDNGILTALEVETIDLAKTELVVLSACETGLGKTAGGKGILGLQRSTTR